MYAQIWSADIIRRDPCAVWEQYCNYSLQNSGHVNLEDFRALKDFFNSAAYHHHFLKHVIYRRESWTLVQKMSHRGITDWRRLPFKQLHFFADDQVITAHDKE